MLNMYFCHCSRVAHYLLLDVPLPQSDDTQARSTARLELNYRGRLKPRVLFIYFFGCVCVGEMSPCHPVQSLCPCRLPFDLVRPPYRRLFHTFFNSLPAPPPSHQIRERPECHFLCECCHCSKPFFFTPFHSQVFFRLFAPVSLSPLLGGRQGEDTAERAASG